MVYKWKDGARMKFSPQIAGEVCEQLESKGNLTPANLVDVSRNEDAPLHSCFEWDDTIAGEEYRKVQAGQIIRFLAVKSEPQTETLVRAFFTVSEKPWHYENINTIITTPDKRTTLLNKALTELKAFKAKYSQLSELNPIFELIENL